jgi:hypothetical protein
VGLWCGRAELLPVDAQCVPAPRRYRSRPAGGGFAEPPRTLAYYAAHEIGHSLTGEAAGVLRYHRLPQWVREGLADYIALPDLHDMGPLRAKLEAGDPAMDWRKSGLYARFRLLVMLALEKHGWTLDRLLSNPPSPDEAEKALL